MNTIERVVARWLLRRLVRQGRATATTQQLFMMLRQQWSGEFHEDNHATKFARLDEIYEGLK